MRPHVSAELFASLDLVVAEPQEWHFPWVGERMLAEFAREQTADALLLGRRTYESFAAAWPTRDDDVPLAARLNRIPKLVVSDTLDESDATWGPVTVIRHRGSVEGAIDQLVVPGRVSVAGSVTLVERLLAAGLLTELRLIVHPVVLGQGRRLFDGWTAGRTTLDLAESVPMDRGARLDVYRPVH